MCSFVYYIRLILGVRCCWILEAILVYPINTYIYKMVPCCQLMSLMNNYTRILFHRNDSGGDDDGSGGSREFILFVVR